MAVPHPNTQKVKETFSKPNVPIVFNIYHAEIFDAIPVGKDSYIDILTPGIRSPIAIAKVPLVHLSIHINLGS